MGVDYDGVGGIGIKVTEEIVEKMISGGIFTADEWEDNKSYCLDKFGIGYYTAGNSYADDLYYFIMVDGNNLSEVNKNKDKFIEKFKSIGVDLSESDLKVISDLYVW